MKFAVECEYFRSVLPMEPKRVTGGIRECQSNLNISALDRDGGFDMCMIVAIISTFHVQ